MRILYISDSYRPSRSACANRTAVLVEALRLAGHDVQVLASSDSLIDAEDNYRPPDYVTFFQTFPLEDKTFVNRLKNNFGGQRESLRSARSMGDFDIVICTTPPLLLTVSAVKIAQMKHAKLVIDVRDIWPDVAYEMGSFTPLSPYGVFFSYLAKKAYAHADLVVSVTPGKVEKLAGCVPFGDVVLVPNGIDETFLDTDVDDALVKSLSLENGPICVYVGNIGLAQGLGTLLHIARQRKGVRFLLFGNGADRAKLEEQARSEGLTNVEFCGSVDARGVYTVLKHADVSYIPLVSSRLTDSIPTKLYEALACGCPVLLAACGDSAALLDESGLGLHAAPEDGRGLLVAFDELVENPYSEGERDVASAWVMASHSRQRFASTLVSAVESLGEQNA